MLSYLEIKATTQNSVHKYERHSFRQVCYDSGFLHEYM